MNYLDKYNKESTNEYINEMEQYALDNNVPIVTKEGLRFILDICKIKKAKKVLEIGTAIAFTASQVALLLDDCKVDTIERNKKMYDVATSNIKNLHLENQVNVIFSDASLVDEALLQNDYDVIFIDAAKAQYTVFFEKFSKLLKEDGIIISDNLLFHGLVESKAIDQGKDLRALVRKIDRYNVWLSENKEFDTTFYSIGDGMALSMRKLGEK